MSETICVGDCCAWEPCRCWTTSPPIPHSGHCCFMDDPTPLDEIEPGVAPPCGHWGLPLQQQEGRA